MLTPVDVQNKVFKGGIGFDKKEVETFMAELSSDYEQLYRSNVELKDKVTTLNESLQHYRSIEDSMQKALTLSEKTAEETINAANDKARQINTEAEKKAEALLEDARNELEETKSEIYRLQQQHAKFKEQFTYVLESQLKIMDEEMIDIDLGDFQAPGYGDGGFGNFSGGGLGGDGLGGGLGGGGGYVGSSSFDGGHERTNQEPAFNRGETLNMDPFADAANGGRFSRQTGGAYNSKSGNKSRSGGKSSADKKENKSSLNIRNNKGNAKVKKNFTATPGNTSVQSSATTVNQQPTQNNAPAAEKSVSRTTAKQTVSNVQPSAAASGSQKMQGSTAAQASQSSAAEASTATANRQNKANTAGTVQQPNTQQSVPKQKVQQTTVYPKDIETDNDIAKVSGEVEDKVNEATMLDSEDNYTTGFDFVSEASEEDVQPTYMNNSASAFSTEEEAAITGEVEDKINEATMLDSEDNYSTGFDFVSEEQDNMDSYSSSIDDSDDNTYSGEVEDRINEATMLDSEDNYSDGFDFVVGNEDNEEDIPTIFPDSTAGQNGFGFRDGLLQGASSLGGNLGSSMEASQADTLHIDPFGTGNDDVFEGDVEDSRKPSNLIGNADDDDEGFNFV